MSLLASKLPNGWQHCIRVHNKRTGFKRISGNYYRAATLLNFYLTVRGFQSPCQDQDKYNNSKMPKWTDVRNDPKLIIARFKFEQIILFKTFDKTLSSLRVKLNMTH